ncbi:hypothetical protein N1027_04190 [Herbiconiux sp. CPCC 205763]|uniref:Uncharacterized protein n=1 Tax=Herbiconiux aconitum TaxID=2970913 RepID=A0ABT2GMA0_9MICO|nr:hypothetical protein [Herbiconiux aconitum]MCS5717333.1 hypothetical protein [Herbiconiux aconitum]
MKLSSDASEVLMVALVVSSLVVRVVGTERGAGFRLVFEGEIAGDVEGAPTVGSAGSTDACSGPSGSGTVVVAIAARRGAARAEARGELGSIVQRRFRLQSGLLGGAGEYAFRVSLEEQRLYDGSVTIERAGVGFAVAAENLLDSATLWFDDSGTADAPVLSCSFWCPAAASPGSPPSAADGGAGAISDLSAALYHNGRLLVGPEESGEGKMPVELRIIDLLDGPDEAKPFRHVQARFRGARAFVSGVVPGVHDLSAHPGVYAIRVTRGREVVARVPFEIDWHGVLREAGSVECRADGRRVMLVGRGRRFGPPPARTTATLDPVYARHFAALRGPERVVLDALHRRALDRLVSDLVLCDSFRLLDAEVERAALHELLTRVEEFESVLPGDYPVAIGGEEVPFERMRPFVLLQLAELDGGAAVVPARG